MPAAGFLAIFFGLLSSGMPIFLVLGTCAAILFYVSGEPLVGVAQVIIDQLNSLHPDGAAAVRDGGGLHAPGRRGARAGERRQRLAGRHPRITRAGHRGGLHAVRRHLRFVGRNRAGDGHHPAAGNDREGLSALLRARRDRCIRNHRHRHPAEPGADPVRHRGRAIGAAPVPGRHPARPAAGQRVLRLGLVVRPSLPAAQGRLAAAAPAPARDRPRHPGADGPHGGAGRHLWRADHGNRSSRRVSLRGRCWSA